MPKDPRVYLVHLLECAGRIEDYIQEGEAPFMRDTKTQDAVIRNFGVIGEAAKRLPDAFREKHPSVPWSLLAGFREVLIYQYDGVDLQRVWILATRDLPGYARLEATERGNAEPGTER